MVSRFFEAFRNSLCFRSTLFILSQSLGRKRAQLQTQNQTLGNYTEHGNQVILDQYFQIPFQDFFRRDSLWIRSLHKQMPDKSVSGMKYWRLRIIGHWNNFCQDSGEKGRCLHWKPLSFSSHKTQTEDAGENFKFFQSTFITSETIVPCLFWEESCGSDSSD